MKTIYNYIVIACLVLPSTLIAQVYYADDIARYEITISHADYVIKAELLNDIVGSRRLELARNKLKLKSADLLGNYLVFKEIRTGYPYMNDLFEVFVDVSELNFEAQLYHFSNSGWQTEGSKKWLIFKCKKSDFIIQESYYNDLPDIPQMLQLNFERKCDLKSASRLQEFSQSSMEASIKNEAFFLSGRGVMEPAYTTLLTLNPSSQLQSSLFNNDSILSQAVYEAMSLAMGEPNFEKIVKYKILFTTAPNTEKEKIYQEYLAALKNMKGLWWDIQYFASQNRDTTSFHSFDEATVFDVLTAFPLSVNVFGMAISAESAYYTSALEAFSKEDFELCIQLLEKEINYNGINHKTLNLIGATYRLQNKAPKALPFLLLAYQINHETLYARGNISLILSALNYPELDKVNDYFLAQSNLDPWSRTQIENMKP